MRGRRHRRRSYQRGIRLRVKRSVYSRFMRMPASLVTGIWRRVKGMAATNRSRGVVLVYNIM